MDGREWSWANLSGDKLDLLQEAEQTLGVDILLAFEESGGSGIGAQPLEGQSLRVAAMNESQVECLQGLEKMLQAVVIGYQQSM
jgi:hypothetical protein